MKKIVVLAFFAGLVAGALAVLGVMELERTFVSVRDEALLQRLRAAHADLGRRISALEGTARRQSGSVLRAVAPSLRQRVTRVVVRECILPAPDSVSQTPSAILNSGILADSRPKDGVDSAPAALVPPAVAVNATFPAPSLLSSSSATPSALQIEERAADGRSGSRAESQAPAATAYARALGLYESGRYAQSRDAFTAFSRSFPRSPLAPNALYWIGETWYAQQRFEQARHAFAQVSTRYPRHAKSADALLKQAYSAFKSGNPALARRLLGRLDACYPGSHASLLGREARRKMRGHVDSGSLVTARG